MRRSADETTKGIVRPNEAFRHFTLDRWDPEPPLDRFVEFYWKTAWELDEPFVQNVVPPPAVNLVFEPDGTAILSGVMRTIFERELEGRAWALGVKFRPGGFRAFSDRSMSELTDERIDIDDFFGPEGRALADAVADAADDVTRVGLIHGFFAPLAPEDPTVGEELSALVETTAPDHRVTKAADLAAHMGVSTRTLQRLFSEHVGVGPKWVLDRHRLQTAAERARQPVESWADVARELGYADQAHLTAALTAHFGTPPAAYARLESE